MSDPGTFADRVQSDGAAQLAGRAVHEPVMLRRVVELLAPALQTPGSIYLDGTLGMAGHAHEVLSRCPNAALIGIDRDTAALQIAAQTLAPHSGRTQLVQAVNSELDAVLDELGVHQFDAMLLDLGLSSLQIDRAERGFSYAADAPLDMRMDDSQSFNAAQLIAEYSAAELTRVLREYGEERFASRIAAAIVAARQRAPITSSAQLVEIIRAALPAAVRFEGGHPAKRSFQGLRIEVNGELDALAGVLPQALDRLAVGGRLVVLSYHSLEDRIVKQAFRAASSDDVPPGLPMVPQQHRAQFTLLTRGAERPDEAELAANPRSASARLRAIERVRSKP